MIDRTATRLRPRTTPFAGRAVLFWTALLLTVSLTGFGATEERRFRYMGSANIAMPTGYTRSLGTYLSDDSHSAIFYSHQAVGRLLEISFLRHLDGVEKDKNVMSAKLKLLEEGAFVPSVVWGVSDIQERLGSKVFYFAGSKTFDAFGVKLHGGFYKDPVTTTRKEFYGIEKTILPLVAVAAERVDGMNTYGIKMNPYPGVTFEYARRSTGADNQHSIYKLSYFSSF